MTAPICPQPADLVPAVSSLDRRSVLLTLVVLGSDWGRRFYLRTFSYSYPPFHRRSAVDVLLAAERHDHGFANAPGVSKGDVVRHAPVGAARSAFVEHSNVLP